MSLNYTKLRRRPTVFLRIVGISVDHFDHILMQLEPLWQKKVLGTYKRPGRPFKLDLNNMLLMLLIYYRTYITQFYLGLQFDLDDANVCRILRVLEPLVAQIMDIQKSRTLTQHDLELLIDATEQPIERPQTNQQLYYSGKKKRHTLKTEVRTTVTGEIVHISSAVAGSVHDFALYKQQPPPPPTARIYVDSGYQGIDKLHAQTELPFKKSKNNPLDHDDKLYNRALSRIRVKVENVLAQLKVFKILSDRYRNKCRRYSIKFAIIAGLVNLKNGFVPV